MMFFQVARGAILAPWQDKPPSANDGGRAELLGVMQPNAGHADVRNPCLFWESRRPVVRCEVRGRAGDIKLTLRSNVGDIAGTTGSANRGWMRRSRNALTFH